MQTSEKERGIIFLLEKAIMHENKKTIPNTPKLLIILKNSTF